MAFKEGENCISPQRTDTDDPFSGLCAQRSHCMEAMMINGQIEGFKNGLPGLESILSESKCKHPENLEAIKKAEDILSSHP